MANRFHRDVWLGAGLMVFCVLVLIQAVQIQGDAAYLPTTLAVLMGVCSLFIILKGLRLTREQNGEYNYSMTIGLLRQYL